MSFTTSLVGVALAAVLSAGGFSFNFSNEAKPSGEAYLVIKAKGDLPALDVEIKGDGQTIKKSVPAMKAGKEYRIDWVQNSDRAAYTLKIKGPRIEGGTNFEVVKASASSGKPGRITPACTREDLVDRKTAKFKVAYDVADYEFNVYDTTGQVAHNEVGGSGKYSAGDTMTFGWTGVDNLFMVEVKARGEQGQTGSHRLVPWQVDIPHVDVIFDSGKAKIKPGEAPKVDKAFDAATKELIALERINQAVGGNIQAQLYIIGFTDTVGPAGKNKTLSNKRAKAIAKYFLDKGIWCEVYYAGMGERGLAVQTPDNTDEARNRRAMYLMSPQRPAAGGSIPGKWTKLSGARPRPSHIKVPETVKLSAPEPKSGGSGSGGDTGGSGGSSDVAGGSGDDSGGDDSGSGSWEDALGDEETNDVGSPPEIGDEPGATKKGCSVDVEGGAGGAAFTGLLAVLFGLTRRRRTR